MVRLRVVTVSILVGAALASTAAQAQTIRNGSFEEKDPTRDRPKYWHHNARNAKTLVTLSWDNEVAHTGQRSVSIEIDEEYPKDSEDVAWMWVTSVYGVKIGETYELTAWIKTEKLSFTPTILVQFRDAGDEFMSRADTHVEYPITGTTDWTQVKTKFQVPEKTDHLKIRAALRPIDNAGGKVWFDDIAITKVGE